MQSMTAEFRRLARDESGWTVAEIGIAAIVIIGAVLAAWATGAALFASADYDRMQKDLQTIQSSVPQIYVAHSDYGTADITTAVEQAGGLPRGMWTGSAARNKFGGTVTITGNSATYLVGYGEVPREVCTRYLASSGVGTAQFRSIAVNGGAAITNPPTPDAAAAACDQERNDLVMAFQ